MCPPLEAIVSFALLLSVPNLAARLIRGTRWFDHITHVLINVHWLSHPTACDLQSLIFECLKCLTRACLTDFQDIVMISSKLESVQKKIAEKTKEVTMTPRGGQARIAEELGKLAKERDKLVHRRNSFNEKMSQGTVLSNQEDRRWEGYIWFILNLFHPNWLNGIFSEENKR